MSTTPVVLDVRADRGVSLGAQDLFARRCIVSCSPPPGGGIAAERTVRSSTREVVVCRFATCLRSRIEPVDSGPQIIRWSWPGTAPAGGCATRPSRAARRSIDARRIVDRAMRHMTAEELLSYRNEPYRQELVAGILREMEPPGGEHGEITMQVGILLGVHVKAHELGKVYAAETGFLLASDPDTVRAPDAAFIGRERAEVIGRPKGYIPGPPDLAIEVSSPRDRTAAVAEKSAEWLRAGARAVVELDPPTRTARVHRPGAPVVTLAGDDPLDLGDVVPGWAPTVAELFA